MTKTTTTAATMKQRKWLCVGAPWSKGGVMEVRGRARKNLNDTFWHRAKDKIRSFWSRASELYRSHAKRNTRTFSAFFFLQFGTRSLHFSIRSAGVRVRVCTGFFCFCINFLIKQTFRPPKRSLIRKVYLLRFVCPSSSLHTHPRLVHT